MSRAKGRTGVWRAAALLAGALTQLPAGQALAQRPGITSAPSFGARPGFDGRSPQKKLADEKMSQARGFYASGDWEAAEAVAADAARMNVAWGQAGDSPAKLKSEIAAARTDAKMLLSASRAALKGGDAARAERYARMSEREAGVFTFTPWGDSPKKVLEEIAMAKAKGGTMSTPTTPAPVAKKDASPWGKRSGEKKGEVVQTTFNPPAPKTVANAAPAPTPPTPAMPGDESEEARQVLKQARDAMAKKDYERARNLVAVARQMKHSLGVRDDNPDKVEADLRRVDSGSRAPLPTAVASKTETPKATSVLSEKPVAPKANGVPRTKDEARAQLAIGRRQLAEGKIDEAAQTAQRIKSQSNVSWGLFEDSPDKLAIDLSKARESRDRDESVRLLAEGRRMYEKGNYEEASKLAYRAQKLHGSYSIWDLGDRPTKLLGDVQTAQAKARRPALPGGTAVVKVEEKKPAPTTPTKPADSKLVLRPSPTPVPTETPVVKAPTPTPPAPAPVASPDRLKAQQLVAEAQRLHRENKLVEARQKAIEAQNLNVRFGPDETSPEFVSQQITMQARQKIDSLAMSAHEAIGQDNATLAAARLEEARAMAVSFGHDARPLEAQLIAVRGMVKSPAPVVQAAPVVPATPAPVVHSAITQVSQPLPAMTPVAPAAPVASPMGLKMLDDARAELRKGETSNARRLAESALAGNYNVRDDAASLLRTIDAEDMNQKRLAAERTCDAALASYRRKEYARANAMLASVDLRMLDAERQGRVREIAMTPEMSSVARATEKPATPAPMSQNVVRNVGDVTALPSDGLNSRPLPTVSQGAGRALVSDSGDGGLLDKHKQMQKVLFEKLRQDGLEAQRDAADKFRAGQSDQALEVLQDYLARVQDERLDAGQLTLLRRPVDSRLSQYRLMKAQKDMAQGAVASRQANADKVRDRFKAEEMKQKNVEKLMKEFNREFSSAHYLEAESLAMRALELDPDNGVASAAVYMARRQRDVAGYEKIKTGRERLVLEGLNDAEKQPGSRAIEAGVDYGDDDYWTKRVKNRKPSDAVQIGKTSAKEKKIEQQLSTPISVSFDSQPLRVVLEELQHLHGVNIVADLPALQEAGVSLESQVTMKLDQISLRSALNLILGQVKLTHTIRDEVLMVTTEENARGKCKPVNYSVADLVIPIENFNDIRNPNPVPGGMNAQPQQQPGSSNGAMPWTGPYALNAGQPAGSPSGSMLNGGGPASTSMASGGQQTTKRYASNTTEEQLIKLITSTIQPRSWSEMGGPGTIEYFPMTLSLIINQTPDIQEQIQELLASLRRLQDQEVSVEVRFISVSEDFFERVGVNFNMNIQTNNGRSEPALQSGAFTFDNSQFINAFRPGRFLAGLTPAGTLTPTLDIPISQNSFIQTVPNFGGYTPGGLTMGLAFLSDIQVFLFLEAAQGNQRANVMQAPKLTMFNGQTATLNVTDQQSFVGGVQIAQIQGTGQYAIVPQTNPQFFGVTLTIQPVISADRRFVRLTIAPTLQNLLPGPINVFPVVVPIFTSIEGTQAGQPVLFTQLLQQPVITNITINTTVAVPDGGTVLMGGLKRLSESRSEYGPPILSKLPYINRLFKNVGYGRETDSMLIMVTPRIIVQAEEEERQTGFSERANPAP